ncbi:phage holin [Lentibacillus sediminis]|uniref:phage holin n=1 Tax=Lentibacillus sediminis TaxID=1940529 RepID=UPI000C1C0AF8|nr:phage holin [Lentibacillus sediminis]
MNINWKLRLQSYPFWAAVCGLIGLILQDFGLVDAGEYNAYMDAFLMLLVASGIVSDPTTAGMRDSRNALSYQKPRKDKD